MFIPSPYAKDDHYGSNYVKANGVKTAMSARETTEVWNFIFHVLEVEMKLRQSLNYSRRLDRTNV